MNLKKKSNRSSGSCKGQLIMVDALLGIIILTILFFLIQSKWMNSMESFEKQKSLQELQFTGERISDELSKNTGNPANWFKDANNAKKIGLANYENKIVLEKAFALKAMDYNKALEKLRAKKIDLYLKIVKDKNIVLEFGIDSNSKNAVTIQRIVEWQKKNSLMTVKVNEK